MFKWLNQDVLMGILRHLLTFGGGYLVAKGHATEAQIGALVSGINDPTLIGAVVASIGIVKSYFDKVSVTVPSPTPVAPAK